MADVVRLCEFCSAAYVAGRIVHELLCRYSKPDTHIQIVYAPTFENHVETTQTFNLTIVPAVSGITPVYNFKFPPSD